jgi:Modifier of rudimentary (Mod(r)) protein/Ubiquitin-conjugating enzyme
MGEYEKQIECINKIKKVFLNPKIISELEIEVDFGLGPGNLGIRIYFTEDYPADPPKLKAASIVSHPKVDLFGIISYDEYENWSPNTDVVDVLMKVYQEFQLNPPIPSNRNQLILPDFKEYKKNFCKPLEDESDFIEFISLIDEYKKALDLKDKLLEQNIKNTYMNIELKKEYNKIYDSLPYQIHKYKILKEKMDKLDKHVEIVKFRYSPEMILARLEEMEIEYQFQAQKIFEKFVKKQISTDQFISEYEIPTKKAKMIQLIKHNK